MEGSGGREIEREEEGEAVEIGIGFPSMKQGWLEKVNTDHLL